MQLTKGKLAPLAKTISPLGSEVPPTYPSTTLPKSDEWRSLVSPLIYEDTSYCYGVGWCHDDVKKDDS